MATKRTPPFEITPLPSPEPYACGAGSSPWGRAVWVEDGAGNGAVIPQEMFTSITVIPKDATPVIVPWRQAPRLHEHASLLLAAALDPDHYYDPAHFDGFFTDPDWLKIVEPSRGLT